MCSLSKEQSAVSREIIQKAGFFLELCPFFDLDFLSCIKHPTTERWHQHVVLLFDEEIDKLHKPPQSVSNLACGKAA